MISSRISSSIKSTEQAPPTAGFPTKSIQKAFSRASKQYDELSGLHQKYALRMLEAISSIKPSSVLDVSCGTGYLSAKIKDRFDQSKVTGLDFSEGMIEQAQGKYQGIDFVLADANQMPFQGEDFDLIVSNLAYQWMPDLTKSFLETHRVLRPHGQLTATLFGYQTCEELFGALEHAGCEVSEFNRFVTPSQVQDHLEQAGFSKSQVQHEMTQLVFKDLWQLLYWLKAIGANKLSLGKFIGPKALQRANEFCLKNFSYHDQVLMSFEIIKIQAIK